MIGNPVTLHLFDPLLAGNGPLGSCTDLLKPAWSQTIARRGGCTIASAELSAAQLTRRELDEFFATGMLREVRVRGGGAEAWRGYLAKMEYTQGNDTFVKDASVLRNALRSIYMRIGDNLLSNGSAETGAWAALNGATVTQSTEWVSHGTYSGKIVVGDTAIRGATIQASLSVMAKMQYLIRATLHVLSGSWRFAANRTDNDESLAFYSTHGTAGDHAVEIEIPLSNQYTGTVNLICTSEAAAGTIYIDACVFQAGPAKAETGWYTDTASIAVHGRKEEILLRAGKSNADANDECQTLLLDTAWPNPQPPESGAAKYEKGVDRIQLTFAGYFSTLNWLYTTRTGTLSRSAWVTTLLAQQSTYLGPGRIETNAADYFVDDTAPLRCGDVLREIAESGSTGGAKWTIGVTRERKLDYEVLPQTLTYYRRNGKLYWTTQGEVEPWLAKPGWCLWQDIPGGVTLTSNRQHDPRWMFLEEMVMKWEDAPGGGAWRLYFNQRETM